MSNDHINPLKDAILNLLPADGSPVGNISLKSTLEEQGMNVSVYTFL